MRPFLPGTPASDPLTRACSLQHVAIETPYGEMRKLLNFFSFFFFQIKEGNARALTGQTCTSVPQSPAILEGASCRAEDPPVHDHYPEKQTSK